MKQKVNGTEFDPDCKTQFVIIPGRYYATMFFVRLPQVPGDQDLNIGGDVNGLIWRDENKPEEWTVQYRFRYYRSEQAFNSGDEKRWYGGEVKGTEEEVVNGFGTVMKLLAEQAGTKVERMDVQGDSEKFFRVVREQRPSWMHFGLPDEVANKGGEAKEN